jgi:hypothetical protein
MKNTLKNNFYYTLKYPLISITSLNPRVFFKDEQQNQKIIPNLWFGLNV